MRGFILAAGFGTRLRPMTLNLPKALVPLAGKPLLWHALEFLYKNGISTLGVNAHYLSEQIDSYRSNAEKEFEIFKELPDIRGTGGALHFARRFLTHDETAIVINVDIIGRFDLARQIRQFEASGEICRLLSWENISSTGTVVYDPANNRYVGAANEVSRPEKYATADFIGMALYRRDFFSLLEENDFSILPVWRRAIDRGMEVSVGVVGQGYWRDIGSPYALAHAHFDVIDGRLDIDPPSFMTIDRQRRCCVPKSWSEGQRAGLGCHCWIEDPSFTPCGTIEQSVVFTSPVESGTDMHNIISTQWGEIPFDE